MRFGRGAAARDRRSCYIPPTLPGPQSPAAPPASEPRGLAASIALALGWVLLATVSLAVTAVALLTTLILAKNAQPEAGWAVPVLLAVATTLLVPFGIVTWRHEGEPWKILNTMAWFPALWNAAGLVLATTVIPDVTAASLRNLEWVVQGRFGDSHSANLAYVAGRRSRYFQLGNAAGRPTFGRDKGDSLGQRSHPSFDSARSRPRRASLFRAQPGQ